MVTYGYGRFTFADSTPCKRKGNPAWEHCRERMPCAHFHQIALGSAHSLALAHFCDHRRAESACEIPGKMPTHTTLRGGYKRLDLGCVILTLSSRNLGPTFLSISVHICSIPLSSFPLSLHFAASPFSALSHARIVIHRAHHRFADIDLRGTLK